MSLDLDEIEALAAKGARPNADVALALVAEVKRLREQWDAGEQVRYKLAREIQDAEIERDLLAAQVAAVRQLCEAHPYYEALFGRTRLRTVTIGQVLHALDDGGKR